MEELNKLQRKSIAWIQELDAALGYDDRNKSLAMLRAGLHALRDRLPPEEAIQLAAELPMLIRGLYYEGYALRGKPVKVHSKEEFLALVCAELRSDLVGDAERGVRAVFDLITRHVSPGEVQDIAGDLPKGLQHFLRT